MKLKSTKFYVFISIILLFFFNEILSLEICDISKNPKPCVSSKEYFYRLNILESDYCGITVEIIMGKVFLNNTRLTDNKEYKTLFVQGAGQYKEIGSPNLPTMYRFVALPQNADYQMAVLSKDSLLVDTDLQIEPKQEEFPDDMEGDTPKFSINEEIYKSNAFYPQEVVCAESKISKKRDCNFIRISTTPFQYNPVAKKLKVYTRIVLKISFFGGDKLFVREKYFKNNESIYSFMLNYRNILEEHRGR